MPYFNARDGARLHYHDVGRGPTCVMLHGFGMRGAMWGPFIRPFMRRRRFVLLDFRGFGRSRGVALAQRDVLQQNADDLHDLMGHLRLRRPELVAFSIGAGSALAYQQSYGLDSFGAYLHLDFSPCFRNKPGWSWGLMGADNETALQHGRDLAEHFEGVDRTLRLESLPAPLQREFWRWFGEFFQACFGQPWWQGAAWLAHRSGSSRRLLHDDSWPIYLDFVRSFVDHEYDFRDSLRDLGIPLWVGVGEWSTVFPPEGGRAMASFAPHTKVIEYRRAGHVLLAEAPVRVLRTLGKFLGSHSDARPGAAGTAHGGLD